MKDICAFSRLLARRAFLIVVLSIINSFNTAPASAQACGTDYVIKIDDSLTSIATKIYGDASRWRIIFYANQDRLEANIAHLAPGRALRMPCLGDASAPDLPGTATIETPSDPAPQGKFVLSRLLKRIEFLTAEGYAPMTGRALPNGGCSQT
jgi:hypothetical protein